MLSNVGQQSSLRMVFFLFLSLRLRSLLSSFYSMHVWIEATLIKTIFFVSWSKPSRVNYFNKIKITDISFFPKGTGAFSRPVKFRFVSYFFVFIFLRSNKKPHTCSATLRARSLSIIVGAASVVGVGSKVFSIPFFFRFLFLSSFFSINMGQRRLPSVDFTLSPSLDARETSSSRRRCVTSARTTTESTIKFYYSLLFQRQRKGPFRSIGLVNKNTYYYKTRIIYNRRFQTFHAVMMCVCVCESRWFKLY